MATVIQIKRASGASAPTTSDLAEGELALAMDTSNDGAGSKLYIETTHSGSINYANGVKLNKKTLIVEDEESLVFYT